MQGEVNFRRASAVEENRVSGAREPEGLSETAGVRQIGGLNCQRRRGEKPDLRLKGHSGLPWDGLS
jgi:hypothetical protein